MNPASSGFRPPKGNETVAEPGKELFAEQVRQQQRLEQPRHWIVRGKDSQHERRPERPKVAAHRQAPPQDLHNRDGKVGALPDPTDAGASMRFGDLSAASELPEEVGKIHARDRKSTRLNSSHSQISYAVFCLKKKKKKTNTQTKPRCSD